MTDILISLGDRVSYLHTSIKGEHLSFYKKRKKKSLRIIVSEEVYKLGMISKKELYAKKCIRLYVNLKYKIIYT